MSVYNTLHFVLSHPLNHGRRTASLLRVLRWQLGSRLLKGAVAIPFVNQIQLLIEHGMSGATGNIYCGLHEFEEMALVLHCLRPDDLFIDVGANVGSYALLGAAAGAHVIAFEPVPLAYRQLRRNVLANDLSSLIVAHQAALGSSEGEARITVDRDTMNHILTIDLPLEEAVPVQVQTLDSHCRERTPLAVKIDVEGFELEVLKGSKDVLSSTDLKLIIIEMNQSGIQYGVDDVQLREVLSEAGFSRYQYRPFERLFEPAGDEVVVEGNAIYLRDVGFLQSRVSSAPDYRIGNGARI